jgi:hypothetical protein
MILVGYSDDRGAFKVMNSWGIARRTWRRTW